MKSLERDVACLFDLLLVGDYTEESNLKKQISDAFNDVVTHLVQIKMEGLATYFGFLQANWDVLESFIGEQFDSIQNCMMINLSFFDSSNDLTFIDQIEHALFEWNWPVQMPKEFLCEIIDGIKIDVVHFINLNDPPSEKTDDSCDATDDNAENTNESILIEESSVLSEVLDERDIEIDDETDSDESISIEKIYQDFMQMVNASENSIEVTSLEFTENQNEIIEIFMIELADLGNNLCKSVTSDNISEKLNETTFNVENLISAVAVIEYTELTEILKLIQLSIEATISDESATLTEYKNNIIWPLVINNLFTSGINSDSLNIISHYIQLLVSEIDKEMADEVCVALANIDLTVFESDKRSEQSFATVDDLSLLPDEETNPELLQSFLDELEDYTGNFTTAIHDFLNTQSFNDLDIARRVVHTIKGSANTAGIRGIANYTHNLEDILDELSKKHTVPSESLSELLIESADYLELMAESILNGVPVPDEILKNYQNILDWAFALDNGLTIDDIESAEEVEDEEQAEWGEKDEDHENDEVHESNLVEPKQQALLHDDQQRLENLIVEVNEKHDDKPSNIETRQTIDEPAKTKTAHTPTSESIRVTKAQIESLIRVVGENMISSGQVLEHAQKSRAQLDQAHKQYTTLNNLILGLEQLVFVRGINSDRSKSKDEFDPLEMEKYNELHTATQRIIESSLDGMQMLRDSIDVNIKLENLAIDQIQLQRDNQNQVIQMRMLPVSFIANRFARAVRQTCRKTNKKVNFNLIGENTLVDSNVLQELVEPIMHILRNAIDHGIEDAEQRLSANKSVEGNITLKFERIADNISVKCIDDGKGLNYEKIIATARKKKFISENQQNFSPEEMTRFILIPGFSTKDELSHVSGRGIGMDVVNKKIHEKRGSLKITSEQNQGTEVSISIPVSLMSTHALLIEIGDTQFAISNRGIEDIIYLDDETVEDIKKNNIIYWNDEAINIYSLADLLQLQRHEKDRHQIAIIVALSDGSYTANIAPFIQNSRDLVVKPLSKVLPRIDGLIGASVLGDGSVAPVYDLTELNEKFVSDDYVFNSNSTKIQRNYEKLLPSILVVDDSISARKSMANFVKDLGYNVIEASDGLEAQKCLDDHEIILVITDLEMPRMNGFDLSSHINSRNGLSDIPIIMVTSRSTQKHKEMAKKVGVHEYMIKPFEEDSLAEKLNELLS